jgi:hypothetical protein
MLARRPLLALALLPIALAACKHKERYDETKAEPVRGAPTLGLSFEMNGTAVAKPSNGDLNVPIHLRNDRRDRISVVCEKCEVELTDGTRCPCKADRDDTCTVPAGSDGEFRLLFGNRSRPVKGSSFRVYLWLEDEKGLIDYVPPLVIDGGGGPFAYPPRPFSRDPSTGTPLTEEFPPPAGPTKTADAPGAAPRAK